MPEQQKSCPGFYYAKEFTYLSVAKIKLYIILVQLPKFKIILVAACFFVVEGVDAHVDFLELFGAVVEWGGGVLLSGYRHYHIGG